MESSEMGPLEDLYLASRAGITLTNTGIDSLQFCRDREHYLAHPGNIVYQFNDRGFRDHAWPQDLSGCIWCIGDSYTVGVGQPFADIWPQQLAQKIKRRTINVSMDGASNAWIARKARSILQEVEPCILILHWSFLHRREHPDADLTDELRRIWHSRTDDDLAEFQQCVDSVEQHRGNTWVIHSAIPLFSPNPVIRGVFLRRCVGDRALPEMIQKDYARDGMHYGTQTARQLVDNILTKINILDVDTFMVT
jgi:hypothetical protein